MKKRLFLVPSLIALFGLTSCTMIAFQMAKQQVESTVSSNELLQTLTAGLTGTERINGPSTLPADVSITVFGVSSLADTQNMVALEHLCTDATNQQTLTINSYICTANKARLNFTYTKGDFRVSFNGGIRYISEKDGDYAGIVVGTLRYQGQTEAMPKVPVRIIISTNTTPSLS